MHHIIRASAAAFLVALAAFIPAVLQLPAQVQGGGEERRLPFASGETLSYELTWRIFAAGTVTATLTRTGQGAEDPFEVRTTAQSRGFVSLVYNVQDEFRSRFNPQPLCSEKISKTINEGRRHKKIQILFDSVRKMAILSEHDLDTPGTPDKHTENAIPACVQDVVSAFYFIRLQQLRVGDEIQLPINDGSSTSEVRVDVRAREKIETSLGPREALRVEPSVFGGLLKRKGRMLLWFSDDEQHLPLRIRAIMSVGTITANLKSVTTTPIVRAP
jgi:Protein of unknown function (DUF3108)